MRYKIIVNPIAGKGFGARAVPRIKQLLIAHQLDFDLVCTQKARQAIALAHQAVLDGYDVIVAAGGDGTCQEVINGILTATHDNAAVHLGVLPIGSGCDFSWAMGIPFDLETACARLAQGRSRRVDVVRLVVDDQARYFDNTLGIGFEGTVTIEVKKFKYLRGLALYLPVVIKSVFLCMKPARSQIEYQLDGVTRQIEGSFLVIDVCNGGRAGGAFMIAPNADAADGVLDVVLVRDIPRLRMLALIPRFLRGTHINQPDVQLLRCQRITVTSADPLLAHADGEMLPTDAHRIECEVAPRKISVIC